MKIKDIITESRRIVNEGRIIHPEDLVVTDGIEGAKRALATLANMANGEELTTIKWDGFPAIVFGRNVDGQLVVADKHMFDKKDGSGRVTSPQAFQQYDINRGANREDLYAKINALWPGLEASVPKGKQGFYMGDLLYAGKQSPTNGFYVFKPNTVTYKVKANSDIGKHIAKSIGGIAVHTFIPGIGEGDTPLSGLGGLPASGPIWFVTGEMPVPKVKHDVNELNSVAAIITKYGTAVDTFIGHLQAAKAKGVIAAISPYITSKISSGTFSEMLPDFYKFLPSKLSASAAKSLLGDNHDGYLYKDGRQGLEGIFAIWVALYNLKLHVKQQIDQGLAGGDVQAFIGNTPGHEGYVVGGGEDKSKIIDRLGFSRANFAKNG